ncbi:MAG: phosphoribosylformylglycinamidine synthase II, partial [Alphaproteobacteria bacterium]|nr:phosphoribosylformylglycinamidine synthase II [Alphaproteobacteria bacterium]
NPQKPEIMWQIVAAIDGIAEACRVLDCPIVSGNCSLYNETNGEGILPTPTIGTIGLIADVSRMASIAFKRSGDILLLLGHTRGHLGQSLYLREIEGRQEGAAPPVDLDAERSHGAFVRELIETGRVDSCHDVADGGLLVAISEMALAGNMGVKLASFAAGDGPRAASADAVAFWFGEDQGRYLLSVPAAQARDILADARQRNLPCWQIGEVGGEHLIVDGTAVGLDQLRTAHEGWFPAYMGASELPPVN